MGEFREAIKKHRAAVIEPHYKFVQFLTLLCAGMLGLSAPLQSGPTGSNQIPAILSLSAMLGLCVSVIAGTIALYGDKNGYDRLWKGMKRLLDKHGGNEILAKEELDTKQWSQPPAIHRCAFHIQWPSALVAVLLLLSSKAAPLFMPSNNPHPTAAAIQSSTPGRKP